MFVAVSSAAAAASTKLCPGTLEEKLPVNASLATARAGWPSHTDAAHASAVHGEQETVRIFMDKVIFRERDGFVQAPCGA